MKVFKPEHRLEEQVFDRQSLFALSKLRQQGHFESVDYPVAQGKEANVFAATTSDGGKVAVKMYRIETSNFIRMHEYLDGDPRFHGTSRKRYETVIAWTRKEYSNLKTFWAGKVCVPRPLGFERNIVVMEFLGIDNIAYSTLEQMGSEHPQKDYRFLLDEMKKIYQLGYVHSDFSEYNILVTDNGLRIIDCGQAVLLAHPKAEDFLVRDAENLARYFKKQGAKTDAIAALSYIKDGKPMLRGLEAIV